MIDVKTSQHIKKYVSASSDEKPLICHVILEPWTEEQKEFMRFPMGIMSGSAVYPQFELDIEPEWAIGGTVSSGSAVYPQTEEFRKEIEGYFGVAGSSTLPPDQPDEISNEFEILFDKAKEEVFEDGMESEFSKNLVFLIKKYGNAAIVVLERLIGAEQVNTEVASEAMRWLGHLEHPITYRSRLHLLERSLHNLSTRVRDGAALGLASLDDPHAIPYLKWAIEREEYEELRHDLEQVLTQLESTYSAFSVKKNTEI